MPLVINEGAIFLVCDESGDVPEGAEFGLYVDDVRVLGRHALTLDGRRPVLLTARATDSASAVHFLTNPALVDAPRGSLSIVRRRVVGDGVSEELEIVNYGTRAAEFSLELDVRP